jgi:hypothetical protein
LEKSREEPPVLATKRELGSAVFFPNIKFEALLDLLPGGQEFVSLSAKK